MTYFTNEDYFFMKIALEEAWCAYEEDEVPVGAVMVSSKGELLAKAHNEIIKRKDPTAHAELLVIKKAAERINNFRLLGCKLYVTLEPCAMCAYAIVLARLEEVIFATPDPKTGAVINLFNLLSDRRLNYQVKFRYGIYQKEAEALLKKFFLERRNKESNF